MISDVFKRISALVLSAAIMVSAFLFSPVKTAASENFELYKMYCLETKNEPNLSDKTAVDTYSDLIFETENEAFAVTKGSFKTFDAMYVEKLGEEGFWPVTLSKEYEDPLDLSSYNELYFHLSSDGEEPDKIQIEITLFSNLSSQTLKVQIEAAKEYDIYYPISQLEGLEAVEKIEIKLSCHEKTGKVIISSIYADESFRYSHISLFSSDSLFSDTEITLYEDRIELSISDGGAETLANLVGVPKNCNTVCTMVTLSGADAGTVTLSVWDGVSEEYSDVATLTLNSGKNRYSFMFPAFKGTNSYRLSFSGVTETENEILTLHGAVMEYFSESAFDKGDYPGTISSCSVLEGGSKIRINGTLRSNTVAGNIGAKLNVYARDERWNSEDGTVLMASVDITTVFEITFGTEKLKLNPYLYKYYVTVATEDSETVASAAVYPSVTPANFKSGNSVLGIQSHDSAAAFKTNASHAVVDVYLDKLLSTDGKGGRVHSYGGSFCYLTGSYINELDSKLSFLNGSGVNVYLRILHENNDPTLPAIYLTPNVQTYNDSLSYMAMIDFLTSRYSDIAGIILGSRIDCMLYSYTEEENIISRSDDYANLLRLTCIAARPNAADAAVIVPFGDGYVYGGDGDGMGYLYDPLSGIGKNAADPVMLSEIISRMISNYGSFRWYLLYECESAPLEAMNTAYKLAGQLTQGGGTSPSGHMVFWQPEKSITSSEIRELSEGISEKAVSLGTNAVIISFTRHAIDAYGVLGTIENSTFGENAARTVTEHEGLVLLRPAPIGRYDIWNFTKSFSTEGFIFGGSVTSLSTEVSVPMAAFEGLDSCRCLKGTVDKNSKASSTVLCYFDTPKLLKNATSFDVSINISSDSKKPAPVKIILGKGNVRYEYSVEISPSTPSVVRCDTSILDDRFAAEYMAVSIEPGTADSFEITKVSAINKNVSEDSLREMLEASSKNSGEITEESKFIIVGIAFIGVTVIIFAMLNVKNGSEKSSARLKEPDKKGNT